MDYSLYYSFTLLIKFVKLLVDLKSNALYISKIKGSNYIEVKNYNYYELRFLIVL